MALVLHELATNAVKHGALAVADGRLEVAWRLETPPALVIEWNEVVPRLENPRPSRRGFGTVLLSRMVEAQLGGRIDSDLTADGLRVRVSIPLEASDSRRDPAAG